MDLILLDERESLNVRDIYSFLCCFFPRVSIRCLFLFLCVLVCLFCFAAFVSLLVCIISIAGGEIAPNTGSNATKFFTLTTKS